MEKHPIAGQLSAWLEQRRNSAEIKTRLGSEAEMVDWLLENEWADPSSSVRTEFPTRESWMAYGRAQARKLGASVSSSKAA